MPYPALAVPRGYWNAVLVIALIGGASLGLMTGGGAADPELVLLLRFMAVVKAGMAVGAAALVAWRMRYAIRPAMAMGYVFEVFSMAAGTGLIWQLGHIPVGAMLVHGGLAGLAVLAWLDRAGWNQAAIAMSASIRSRRSGSPGAAIRMPPGGTSRQQPRSPSIGSDTSSSPVWPSL